jgi:hypothetical protein
VKTPRSARRFFLPSTRQLNAFHESPTLVHGLCACHHAGGQFASAAPQNYLFTDSGELSRLAPLLKRPDIGGAQIVYTWKSLEPARDQYDFTQIEKDLRYLED